MSLIQPDERLENDVRAGGAGALSIRTWLSGKGLEIYEKITNLKCFTPQISQIYCHSSSLVSSECRQQENLGILCENSS